MDCFTKYLVSKPYDDHRHELDHMNERHREEERFKLKEPKSE